MFEHYVAVDNVCAWPNLTKMPDGVIIATIFNQPCHGLWEGDVECWASEGGDARPLLPWVCRSSDGGRTWTRAETLPPLENKSTCIIPFGDIVQLRDGRLGVCIYSWQPPDEHNCYFYSSTDDGRSWTIRGVIQERDINETTPLVLENGDLLACARTLDDQHLELFRSTDHGRTWSSPLVLHESNHQADKKWPASDGGYPASVELSDGTIVTAFYSSCVPPVP